MALSLHTAARTLHPPTFPLLAHRSVFFLGFTGGFPYLGGLPSTLASVPRLATPRQQVPRGSVGIAGGQTGVYTLCTPGGWHILGKTPLPMFDAAKDPPAALRAGDIIKFVPADGEAPVDEEEEERAAPVPETAWVEVLAPGPMTTVQDIGRHGYARHGVSRSGAADDLALCMGNALVGNDDDAAGLEVTMGGLQIRCVDAPCAVALTGAGECRGILFVRMLTCSANMYMENMTF